MKQLPMRPGAGLVLASLYVFSVAFIGVWRLPVVGLKVQPAELVFVPLALVAGRDLLRRRKEWKPIFFDFAVLAYLLANGLSALHTGSLSSLLEAAGRGYLAVVYLLFRGLVQNDPGAQAALKKALLATAFFISAVSVTGWLLATAGYPNFTVRTYSHYPYLGTIYRAAGFTPGMTMLISILAPALLISFADCLARPGRVGRRLVFGLTGLACLLTFSKTLLLLLLGLVLLWGFSRKYPFSVKVAVSVVFSMVFWLGTHFLITASEASRSDLVNTQYTSNQIVWKRGELTVFATSYTALKLAAWQMGNQNLWLGVGPGMFNQHLPGLKETDGYPGHLPNYDPHSTFWGNFAELGLPGLALTVLLYLALARIIWKHSQAVMQSPDFLLPLVLFLLLTAIESLALDIMNFRHVWMIAGVVVGGVEDWKVEATPKSRFSKAWP